MITDGGEPECYQEAMSHEHKGEWIKAMPEEKKSLHENHTFELVKLPNLRAREHSKTNGCSGS